MPKGQRVVRPKMQAWKSQRRNARIPDALRRTRDLAPDYQVPVVEQRIAHKGGQSGTYVEAAPVYAEVQSTNACTTTRACPIELAFLGAKHATAAGVKPGVYLRLCAGPKVTAGLIPVKDHREAMKIAKAFCACKKAGDSVDSCMRKSGGKPAKLDGAARRRRR
jgi:hypothetical protein